MTNEKAIKILSSYKNSYFGDALHGGVISVSEIIELLSAQPEPPVSSAQSHENDDLISRQAAIDAVKKNTFRLTFAEEQNCEGHVAWRIVNDSTFTRRLLGTHERYSR